MTGQYILSFFLVIGCFVGLFLAGIGGLSIFYDEVPYQGTIKGLSATILVGCILEMALGIFGFYVICAYGKYFGYHIVSNNRRAVIIIKQPNSIGTAQVMTNTSAFVLNDPYMFTAGGGFNNAGTTNANVQALQEQNRLLQEQLRLQQELNQQRNQPFGFEGQPAPPPSYGHYS
ncbi:hypothetical protein DPMN_058702 [Dreissena polymorpha]|nr:hypothetical protein DPMN_058702 [Dreissena polymorpha]